MKKIIAFILLLNLTFTQVYAAQSSVQYKHPDYGSIFLNYDKHEKMNRKIFNFNLKLNRIFVRKIHVLWASLFPDFVVNSLNRAYSNIEYPKRLISSLLQRDFDAVKNETKRFIINTTIGVGGLIDAADKLFKLELYNEDMEQALAKCKMRCGNYLVMPFVSSCTTRDLTGRILDFALNPTTYIATPITAAVKMGLLINRTAYIQPLAKMVESNFADPYDIAKKFYGAQKYIKQANYDRKKVLSNLKTNEFENRSDEIELVDKQEEVLDVKGKINESENLILNEIDETNLSADIILNDYNPQNPVLDSMRTALFDLREQNKSIWNEMSIWNRSFAKKIKSADISLYPNRAKYHIKFLLQKDKMSPLAIIFPSVGEGVNNNHSVILAKTFYDEGYSILILGSHFQWEFLQSIEKGHKPGLIKDDIKYINQLTNASIDYLSKKYDRVFLKRTAMGTSLGAYAVMFLGNYQYETGARNIDKFIAVCPPTELTYAIEQMDKIIGAWKNYPDDIKEKIAITAAKVIKAYEDKEKYNSKTNSLPFSNYEAKLISAFIFHQKLSDLILTLELDANKNVNRKELYNTIHNSDFKDYLKKYFLNERTYEELAAISSMRSIADYLINSDNYRIYHSLDDYLTNKAQLSELKKYCDNKLTLFNNGAHLGFLYRDEFNEALKKEIKL